MAKDAFSFDDFLLEVRPENLPFVTSTHKYLLANGCTVKIESAKSGYVVSYNFASTKKVVANYVFRKKGMLVRLYADNIGGYSSFLDTLPSNMKADIEKSSACKRLLDPTKCNSKCSMGFVFNMDGTEHKKCRYNLMFLLSAENNPFIRQLLEKELAARAAKQSK